MSVRNHWNSHPYLTRTPPDRLMMLRATPSPAADLLVKEGDIIRVGSVELKALHTPGHSRSRMSLHLDGMVFIGDTLTVGSVGRKEFSGSSWEVTEISSRKKLYTLPGDTVVFPGHNYGSTPSSTIQYEKCHNPLSGVRGGIEED